MKATIILTIYFALIAIGLGCAFYVFRAGAIAIYEDGASLWFMGFLTLGIGVGLLPIGFLYDRQEAKRRKSVGEKLF